MILLALKSGWPDRVVSWDHAGAVPAGHMAVESIAELDAWKAAHPELVPPPAPVPDPVPEVVSRRQFRGALRRLGLFELVDGLRNAPGLDDMTRGDLIDFLDAATLIERNHPMISAFAPMLGPNGVTEAQIDDVFRLAASL